jgi:hypothetical protein
VALELPEETPAWLRDALSHLTTRDLGCHYTSLLRALVRLEESAGFDDAKPTPLAASKARPVEVAKWIRGGRGGKMKHLPAVKNVDAYGKQWYTWWDEMQPHWRKRGEDGYWVVGGEYGDEWGALDCAGVNGNLSFVAALYFWGAAESHTEDSRALWERAVLDVVWMLEGVDTLFEE